MKAKENSENLKLLLDEAINEKKFDSLMYYISQPENKVWEYIEPSKGHSLLFILLEEDLFDIIERVLNIIIEITTPEIFLNFLNHKDNQGLNAFHFAIKKKNLYIIKLLLKYGIDLTLPIEKYETKSNTIFSIGFGALLICLDDKITKEICDSIIELSKD